MDIEREAFEQHHHLPDGATWNEKLRVYRCVSSPNVNHPINENWETWQEAIKWQAAQAPASGEVESVGFIPSSGINNLAAGHPAKVYPVQAMPSPFESHKLIYTHPPAKVPERCQHENAYRTALGYIVCYQCQKTWHPDDDLPNHLQPMRSNRG